MDELSTVLKARALINKVAPTGVPVPIEAYAGEIGAVLRKDKSLGPDEAGYSFEKDGRHYICVNANDRPERQRFTACHEIAHIVLGLPSDHEQLPWWSYAKRPLNEILCDVFAAELLLPYGLFKRFVDKADISLAAIDELAGQFETSTTAAGSRFAAVAGFPCAFVLSEKGAVRYASRSTTLRQGKAWITPRMALPAGSVCARLHGGGVCDGPEETAADLWFSSWDRGGTLLEDARHLQQWNQTIALLWFEDEELPPPSTDRSQADEEGEQGLAELDGILPWPGKKRRR
ncbi:MAG: ImmA/IrrE family metallo-endopeptidase [Reyranella sp.]|uniref:ImmA/IrrE family metallo-endopeptidase n=1 Tax=Reyranella aquatilis TaxID=2035356 RepID=A0ABS8KUF3_9HYPH|nr:ImmA/IrrE family metallo-endopeptidase [Reyranella aquatilis]MCC8429372.1 ImmA/IrrE family metallo-endopeptidase [Reyranella aquatilis]MDP3162150.1 ImmA/IrrE family metallo-endopeptidase [Reyranella sp.]